MERVRNVNNVLFVDHKHSMRIVIPRVHDDMSSGTDHVGRIMQEIEPYGYYLASMARGQVRGKYLGSDGYGHYSSDFYELIRYYEVTILGAEPPCSWFNEEKQRVEKRQAEKDAIEAERKSLFDSIRRGIEEDMEAVSKIRAESSGSDDELHW